jgi:hypothetical protein
MVNIVFRRFFCSRSLKLATLLGSCLSQYSQAADFNVTKTYWGTASDTGTFAWAVNQANSTVGLDTIHVQSGLNINVDGAATVPGGARAWLAKFTESVNIEGNNATLEGNPTYITSGGLLATKTSLVSNVYGPPIVHGDIVTTPGVSFAIIGEHNQNNTGIHVSVNALNADGLGSIAFLHTQSTLTYKNSNFNNIVNYTGDTGRPAFNSDTGSTLNLNSVVLNRNIPFGGYLASADNIAFGGSILGGDAFLNMSNSTIEHSYGAGAILWVGGVANVVSSILSDSGGIQVSDSSLMDGTLNFVNSILYVQDEGETLQQTSRILADTNSVANITSSTILYNSLFASGDNSPFGFEGMPLTAANAGILNINSSAILPLNFDYSLPGKDAYLELTGGNLISDSYSFIGATTAQSSADLHLLFNNSSFLSSGLTYSFDDFGGTDYLKSLPVGATPWHNSVLVNVVPNAGSGGANELLNPINSQPILYDVFGHARTSGGFRTLGAVQSTVPEPSTLTVVTGTLLLGWLRRRKTRS